MRPELEPAVWQALAAVARHPVQALLVGWNWKAALFSLVIRGVLFGVAARKGGWQAAGAAALIEAVSRAVMSGVDGSVAQALRHARPPWLSALLLVVVVPGVTQLLEYLVHAAAATPNLVRASIASTALAGLGSVFTWFAMRRGVMIVGDRSHSFREDLRQLPGVVAEFTLLGPRWLMRLWRR